MQLWLKLSKEVVLMFRYAGYTSAIPGSIVANLGFIGGYLIVSTLRSR